MSRQINGNPEINKCIRIHYIVKVALYNIYHLSVEEKMDDSINGS